MLLKKPEPLSDGPVSPLAALSETRVRAFDFSDATRTEPLTFLTDRAHQTSSTFSCGLASDLVGFLSEDPLPHWFPPEFTTPEQVKAVYTYGSNDPASRTDPLGLLDCPAPAPGLPCAANCAAQYQHGLCQLKKAKQGTLILSLVGFAGGAAKGYLKGNLPGACIQGGLGLMAGYAAGKLLYGPATEAVVRQEYANCNRNCEAQKCLDSSSPCRGFFGGSGAPRE